MECLRVDRVGFGERRGLAYSRALSRFKARAGCLGYLAIGTRRDARILRSLVTRETRCTMLVAAMISSAGSPLKSRRGMARQTSSERGQVWSDVIVRTNSGLSRSTSMRPRSASLAISQITIDDMLQESPPHPEA